MTKIRALTTFRNEDEIGGLARSGEEYVVSDDYAKEIVEEKGRAEYVETQDEKVETIRGDFPKGFLQEKIPGGFPNDSIRGILDEAGINNFNKLLNIKEFTEIKGISEDQDDVLNEAIPSAISAWKDKNL